MSKNLKGDIYGLHKPKLLSGEAGNDPYRSFSPLSFSTLVSIGFNVFNEAKLW
jgi:hypothetical protein